ncbi:MAG: hypothetical protein D6768_01295 [Chloroflexi bacterium]|nr:MAG: hypothetical protein D6768_01295 [Chloroflexota bacterium]
MTENLDVEITPPLNLRVVPLALVVPHETVDPRRVERLVNRLNADGKLANPPIVIQMEDHYVVLDGATRVTAMKQLGFPHIVAQVVSPESVNLNTWHHVIRKVAVNDLLALLGELPEITLTEQTPPRLPAIVPDRGDVCALCTANNQMFLVQAAPGVKPLTALNRLTETYIAAGRVMRALTTNLPALKNEHPDLSALVVFPAYRVEQVLQIARAGNILPAGITRFLIPGRVLRLNAGLEYLKSDASLTDKNRWLYDLVVGKFSANAVRYYQEPVYLLDE